MKRSVAFLVPLFLFFAIPSPATTIRRLTLDDLVVKANSIVVGRVMDSRTYWTNDRKLILTSYTIAVQQNLKGAATATILVTTIGGRIGSAALQIDGMPVMAAGEDAVLFLEQSGSYTTVVGLKQGRFAISSGEVANSVGDLTFENGVSAKPLKMSLDEFKRQIQLRLVR